MHGKFEFPIKYSSEGLGKKTVNFANLPPKFPTFGTNDDGFSVGMGSEGEREATRPKVVEKGQNFCNGMDAAAAAPPRGRKLRA